LTIAAHLADWSRLRRPVRSQKEAPLTLIQETLRDVHTVSRRRRAVTPQPAEPPSPIENGPLVTAVLASLEDAKAEDIVKIDLTGKTSLADTMLIATGRSNVHVGAIADRVAKACRDKGGRAPRIEGQPLCDWVLIDMGDAIIHIFRPEVRRFYNLEKLWSADRPGESRTG
jgi:ribosome-associated protein